VKLKTIRESTVKRRGIRNDAADGDPNALPAHAMHWHFHIKATELRTTRTVI
jgi:hypothetical protein